MRQGRDYWSRQVAAWRRSGQSKKAYCEKHGVSYWSLRHWAAKLAAPAAPEGQRLVELERVGGREPSAAIELVVGERYLLRLWPQVRAAQLREVLGGAGERSMIHLELGTARIFVRPGATDMRKQINGLVLLVQEQMQLNPFEPALCVFCNAQRRVLKAVYWDRTGFCLWMKRLESGRFPWPRTADQARRQIDAEELRMLLLGIDFWNAHEELRYAEIA